MKIDSINTTGTQNVSNIEKADLDAKKQLLDKMAEDEIIGEGKRDLQEDPHMAQDVQAANDVSTFTKTKGGGKSFRGNKAKAKSSGS